MWRWKRARPPAAPCSCLKILHTAFSAPRLLALALAALAATTAFCIFFVDRPVALFFAAHHNHFLRHVFQLCAAPSLLALPAAAAYLCIAIFRRVRGLAFTGRVWLATSIATLAGTAAKDELKWFFGRPWPESWLKYGFYQFHPLTGSILYGGFPSGHTAYISAPLGVLWVLRPRYRLVWGTVMFLVMLGLVGAGYHFVGDVLAGLITGLLCAWGSLILLTPERLA
jgi:membrane-associated phospholipid phosphatase